MSTLSFTHIRKRYASTVAVDDVSFDVHSGEIFGLLGPNGAGKTTLIRILMNIILQDEGSVLLDGRPVRREDLDRIGYLPEERGLYRKERVGDVLTYFGMLKGLDRKTARERTHDWLHRVELPDVSRSRVDELSKGMQQKVQIAGTLMHEPSIIVMDEPFTGLDPVNTVLIKDLLKEMRDRGALVILSTHQMPMVEALCDRVAMIHLGRLVLYGELKGIQGRYGLNEVLVDADGAIDALPVVDRTERRGGLTRVILKSGSRPRDLMDLLVARGIAVEHFEVVRTPVEDIFVRVVRGQG
jgi:ABC-2 type transport system ATP-binding protein